MNSLRKTSLVAGVFYLLTFVSIPTLSLYGPVRGPNFVTGPGPDGPVILGVLLEMVVALAGIGPQRTARRTGWPIRLASCALRLAPRGGEEILGQISVRKLLVTEKTPGIPLATWKATFFSSSEFTTPSSRTFPFLTTMCTGGTA